MSPAAVEAMRRNVELNDLHGSEDDPPEGSSEKIVRLAKVRVNEGDAWWVLAEIRAFIAGAHLVQRVDVQPPHRT